MSNMLTIFIIGFNISSSSLAIKTSTGFSKAGATFEDIKLFYENIGDDVKIKAAGGISSIEDAENFISLGAERLGTSRVVKIVKASENNTQENTNNVVY